MNSPSRPNPGTNLRELSYEYIRTKLLEGRIPPGTRISSRALAREIGVSFIPVREAIAQLASEGLVAHEAGVGTFGNRVGRDELRELYELREALELHAVVYAAQRIDERGLAEMKGWNEAMRDIAKRRRESQSHAGNGHAANGYANGHAGNGLGTKGLGNGQPSTQGHADGHATNGYAGNGLEADGFEARAQGTNGHAAPGRATHGHAAGNGHAGNGHGTNGHGTNGHGANGHGANGHAANGHAEGLADDLTAWNNADIELHLTLLRAAGNSRLVRAVRDLRILTQVFRAQRAMPPVEDLERICEEHHSLIEALARRDGDAARTILSEHIRTACRKALESHVILQESHVESPIES